MAVWNHFKNWCRTKSRRCKERSGDDFACLTRPVSDGHSPTPWEENLADGSESTVSQAALYEQLGRVAPALLALSAESVGATIRETALELTHRREAAAEREVARKGTAPTVEPASVAEAAGHCILSDLSNGYSLREAIERLDVNSRDRDSLLRTCKRQKLTVRYVYLPR